MPGETTFLAQDSKDMLTVEPLLCLPSPDPLYRGGGSGGGETMGVYDHMMRPSMGHRMQVELRENMQNYHNNKNQLQSHLSGLCLDSKDLYNSPPSPASSIKTWGEAGSRFSTAPEKAAKKARLAKLEQENSTLSKAAQQNELKSKHTLLPPIPGKGNTMGAEAQEKTDSSCQIQEEQGDDSDKRNLRFGASVELKTPLKTKPTTTTTTATTTNNNKASKSQKKGKGKKPALKEKDKEKEKEQKPRGVLKLPIILPINNKWAQWDSGYNHVHRKGKSTGLEKSQIEEDCRNFSQRSMAIPSTLDRKRMEIKLPPLAKPPANQPKVKFTGRQPKKSIPVDVVYMQSMPDEASAAKAMVLDHFPHGDKRLPDFDDSSSGCAESDDEADGPLNESGQLLLPPLPVVRLSHHNLKQTTHHVPRLHLERITSPGLMSVETGRSGKCTTCCDSYPQSRLKGNRIKAASQALFIGKGEKNKQFFIIFHVKVTITITHHRNSCMS